MLKNKYLKRITYFIIILYCKNRKKKVDFGKKLIFYFIFVLEKLNFFVKNGNKENLYFVQKISKNALANWARFSRNLIICKNIVNISADNQPKHKNK